MADIDVAILTPAAVTTAVGLSSPGDTIVLPAGTAATWTSAPDIPAGRSLRGQGVASTILQQTSGVNKFFTFNSARASTTYSTEISGFRCTGPGITASSGYGIHVYSLPEINIHDIFVEYKSTVLLAIDNCVKGVIYNSTFKWCILTTSYGSGGYGVAIKGTSSWPASYPILGTGNTIFVEDNTFYGIKQSIQGQDCANYVARYNTISGCWGPHGQVDLHGARDAEGENSSSLQFEIYNNDVTLDVVSLSTFYGHHGHGTAMRGGHGVCYNNVFHSAGDSAAGDCVVITPTDISAHTVPVYVFLDDYPILWQPRDIYAWENTYDGAAVSVYNSASSWFEENRSSTNSMGTYYDYVNSVKSGYTAYAYPHPLRPTAGGGTYRIEEGAKVVLV